MNNLIIVTTPQIIAAFAIGIVLSCWLGYRIGRGTGLANGKAIGWQDGYFGRIEEDKKNRETNGRYKPRNRDRNHHAGTRQGGGF